jgi:serine/threonine-protein kinase
LLLEQALAEFTQALRKKQNPEIARWFNNYPMLDSSELFRELLMTEIHHRRQAMEQVEPEDYLNRYPDRAEEIHSAFAEMAESLPQKSLTATMETIDQHNPPADTRPDNDWLQTESGFKHKRIGDYQLLEQLGKGGMGMVFRARQISLNRNVALKLILRNKSESQTAIDRFQAEAKAIAKLDHPNVIQIFETGTADGSCFIAMPLLEGGTLDQPASKIEFSRNEFLAKIADVADGLHHAHQRGIVHRDIKPANILLDKNLVAVLADFGLAKSEDASELTRTSQVFGTPAYFHPNRPRLPKTLVRQPTFTQSA